MTNIQENSSVKEKQNDAKCIPAVATSYADDVLVVGRKTDISDVGRVTEVALVFGLREREREREKGIRHHFQLTYYQ